LIRALLGGENSPLKHPAFQDLPKRNGIGIRDATRMGTPGRGSRKRPGPADSPAASVTALDEMVPHQSKRGGR
jgi:hypothetical protein